MAKIYTYEEILNDKVKYDEVFSFIKKYGSHSMAYSILQPKMEYYIIDDIGLIAYSKLRKKSKTKFVLGDPFVSNENAEEFLKEFLKDNKKSCFLQSSEKTALLLNKKFSFYVSIFGTETILEKHKIIRSKEKNIEEDEIEKINKKIEELRNIKDELFKDISKIEKRKEFWQIKKQISKLEKDKISKLKIFNEEKSKNHIHKFLYENEGLRALRRDFNLAKKIGLIVEEINQNNVNSSILKEISNEWLMNNTSESEMSFLTKPFILKDLFKDHKKLFILKDKKEIYGFIELEPMFFDNKIIGYYADILRTKKNIPQGGVSFLILTTIEILFSEGFNTYSLGLAPFNRVKPFIIEDKKRIDNKIATFIFRSIFKYGNYLYNSKGQAYHKEKFGVLPIETFYCSRKKFPVAEIIKGFFICNLSPIKFSRSKQN